jgi:hypothetical protein
MEKLSHNYEIFFSCLCPDLPRAVPAYKSGIGIFWKTLGNTSVANLKTPLIRFLISRLA